MTVEELLKQVDEDPAKILKMSDDELDIHLAPLIPLARAPFVGRKTEKFKSNSSGKVVSQKYLDAKTAQVLAILQVQQGNK